MKNAAPRPPPHGDVIMATRTSGRARVPPVYDERALSRGGGAGGPAWAREQGGAKENAAPGGAGRRSEGGRKAGGGAGDKARPARKSVPAVAQKGRDAGLERLPIGEARLGAPAVRRAGRAGRAQAPAPLPAAPLSPAVATCRLLEGTP